MKLPLNSGTYSARSSIANSQRCENLFPEINPQESDPEAPVTHYPKPGLKSFGKPAMPAAGRGAYKASNGNVYAVVGSKFCYVDANGVHTQLGVIGPQITPVSMSDNGQTLVLVDGTAKGYTVDITTNTWGGLIADPTGTFVGSVRVDYSDTFFAFAAPGTNRLYLGQGTPITFNALNQANKASKPDSIATLAFNLRQLWPLGSELSSEIWYLSGAADFPYEEWPNIFIPYGCVAPYSLSQADVNLMWLSINKDGERICLQNKGYDAIVVSTRALEWEWATYPKVSDAVGSSYQMNGHTFYKIDFPTADVSWVYDLSTKQWHRRTWIDNNGKFHRDRVGFYTGGYNGVLGQDWATGELYIVDQNTFTDNNQPIVCRRSFPHIVNEMKELTAAAFVADMETGDVPNPGHVISPWSDGFSSGFGPLEVADSDNLRVGVRLSKNGGESFGNFRFKGLVGPGEFRSMMRWRNWGMGRDLVFEIAWSYPGRSALQGAFFDPIGHEA